MEILSHRKFRLFLLLFLSGIAVGIFVLAVLPYGTFKGLFDSLMRDGDFESLRASNAIVFRSYLTLAGLGVLVLVFVASGKWRFDRKRFREELSGLWCFLRPGKGETPFLVALVIITLFGVAIRLTKIYAPVSHDEAYTITVFSPSLWYAVTNYHAPNNHVLHTVLVHISTAFLGLYPWAVRLPAFLAGTLLIPAAYFLGKAIYDSYSGILAAMLVAGWPEQISYSTTARGYSLVALFALVTFWLGILVSKERNRVAWLLLVIFSALGFYAVPVMLYPFGILFIWLLLENTTKVPAEAYRSKIDFLKYWLLAGIATAVLTLLLYSPILIYGGVKQFFLAGEPNPFSRLVALAQGSLRGMYFELAAGIPHVVTYILIFGIFLSWIFHRRLSSLRIPIQAPASVWIAIILVVQRPNAWSRIWFPILALFAIWGSAGIAGLIKDFRIPKLRNVSLAIIPVSIAFIWIFSAGIKAIYDIPEAWASKGKEESAILFLKDRLGEQDIIVAPTPQDAPLWYYSRLYGIADRYFSRNSRPFQQAFLITVPKLGQYKQTVLEEFGLADSVDLQEIKLLKEINGMNIYEVPHK